MYHIKQRAESQTEFKKSRFIGIILPVDDESMIKDRIGEIKKEYPAATHYCYAAMINGNGRSNDDGEPSSTAGKPILQALQSRDLDNVLLVVVRYFGGTLLGTSGLIKAYGQTASAAIDNAIMTRPLLLSTFKVTVDYSYTSKIEHLLQANARIDQRDYGEMMSYLYQSQNSLEDQIRELTSGNYLHEFVSQQVIEIPIKEI